MIFIENVLKCLLTFHQGVREFYFFMLGGIRVEKGWDPLLYWLRKKQTTIESTGNTESFFASQN